MKPERFTRNIRDEQDYCEFEVKDCPYQSIYDFKDYEEIEGNVDCELTLAIDKLGQLEDIEERYGIGILTIFKALTDGCYYYYNGKIEHFSPSDRQFISLNLENRSLDLMYVKCYGGGCYVGKSLLLGRYGISWALTKEELEK